MEPGCLGSLCTPGMEAAQDPALCCLGTSSQLPALLITTTPSFHCGTELDSNADNPLNLQDHCTSLPAFPQSVTTPFT